MVYSVALSEFIWKKNGFLKAKVGLHEQNRFEENGKH